MYAVVYIPTIEGICSEKYTLGTVTATRTRAIEFPPHLRGSFCQLWTQAHLCASVPAVSGRLTLAESGFDEPFSFSACAKDGFHGP